MSRTDMTQAQIKAIKKVGRHRVADGLYVSVYASGLRTYMARKEGRWSTLGKIDSMSLKDAKIAAIHSKPVDKKVVDVFSDAAEAYLADQKGDWASGKTEQRWRNVLDAYLYPVLGKMKVLEITATDCADALRPIWRDKYPTAKKARQYMERVILSVHAHNNVVQTNPADMRLMQQILGKPSHKQVHHAAPEVAQLKRFLADLSYKKNTHWALRWVAATVVRSNEARSATTSQINWETRSWDFIPKMGELFRVPITAEMERILEDSDEGLLFPGLRGQPLSDNALSKLLRDRGESWTPHGIRAAFATWAEDEGVDYAVREMCLDHRKRGVEAAYARSDLLERRRAVLQQWNDLLFSN